MMQNDAHVDKPDDAFYVKGTMFVVDHILVSDELAEARFSCNLGGCHGACCVHGDSGAPLDADELAQLEEVVPATRKYLSKEALEIVDRDGPWEETSDGRLATRCVDGKECVFVTYEGAIAKCAIQKAHAEGRTAFVKPVSCHLFPLRVEHYGTYEVLNYERVGICDPGRNYGARKGIRLSDYLKEPLVRKYGEEWYDRFQLACEERRLALAG